MQMQNIKTVPQTWHSHPPRLQRNQPARWISIGATLCAVLTLSACASLGGGNPQEQVRQRATQRWQALVAGEFSRAYTYTTPAFRAVISVDAYRSRFGAAVTWLGAEVTRVECPEADKCTTQLRIEFRPTMSRKSSDKVSTYLDETWLFEGGQWWYFEKI